MWPNDVNSKFKYYLAAIALLLPQAVTPLQAEPATTGKCSSKIRQAILDGLPQYDGRIYHAPVEQPPPVELAQLPVDPEVVILPAFTISDSRGTRKVNPSDAMRKPKSKTLVAGTGVSEFTLKKFKITVPTILFIPIGFKFSW